MDAHQNIDALFAKAKLTPTAISFSESKGLFMKSVEADAATSKGKFRFINFKSILIMIGIIGIAGLLINISISDKNPGEITRQNTEIQQKVQSNIDSEEKVEAPLEDVVQASKNNRIELWVDVLEPLALQETNPKRELVLHYGKRYHIPQEAHSGNADRVSFPKLTEKEIAANKKQKKKMIKALSRFDHKEYAYIPSSSFSYKGKQTSVNAFYMQRKEVTNLEYRTFLFDLLIQGRKKEFLTAAPDQTLWTKALHDSLANYQNEYFSNSMFNDFPVVNVSKKGVEMYCKWITEETNKTRGSNYINDARIPEIVEWSLAASNLGKNTMYPWEGKELTTEGEFNANFKLDEYEGSLQLMRQRTKSRLRRTTFEYNIGLMIAWVKSYEPNELGLYNMSGNVAEMVSVKMTPDFIEMEKPTENQLVTCGGSWMSEIEDLEVFNENLTDYINGHPSIGFRVVITHLGSTK